MAIASLALSFLAFIVPLGVTSVVMGHVSRKQIAKSNGQQTGTGLAFAGLIISYLQLVIAALVFLGAVSLVREMNREMDRDRDTRALLAERLKYGGTSDDIPPELAARHQKAALNAMRLIVARQDEYLASHPEGYACSLNDLENLDDDQELTSYVAQSGYSIYVSCRRVGDDGHVEVAVPRSTFNPPTAPVYCVDQTKIIRRHVVDFIHWVNVENFVENRFCPADGVPVEQ
jgi:hypothetical protein